MAYIEFHDVVKRFGDNTVLDHINFGIEKGDLVTLLGPSGCGKSTLLRCLSGLEQVTEGKIILDGADVTNVPASKRNIGMVFQQYSLFPNMNVEQNIAFGLKMQKVPTDQIAEKVARAVDMVELKGKEKMYPANLSGGQQQRVALARSIVTEPKVLLLDEPLSAIDAKLRRALQSRIREIQQELGLTSIFVTHDQDEAMVMSDVIQLFHAGRIEQAGSPVDVYTKPISEFAASFIGSYNQLTAAEFADLTGERVDAGNVVAVRPETIGISTEEPEADDAYVLKGMVVGSMPRGNVLRYTVRTRTSVLRVDVLFRSFHMFNDGETVYLALPKHDCLVIPAAA
ncbi:ABC transporter ATP-binding protein [Collinsella sp. An2]|uniref:ABC transporter ATP-binding protein n=1 Tax=Collinsella sp. An2 TaxID=1965585 RepID=UPI000B36C88E|nr:ABC transporter ATP-binding protein [Collinsella sp. An2]OUP10902.1 ABC transporter ATP-binding protein [Collinsella sp. An2]